MRLAFVASAAALATLASASPVLSPLDQRRLSELIVARTHAKLAARDTEVSYVPKKNQACPFPATHNYVRPANALSPNETAYVGARLANAKDPLRAFFAKANLSIDGLDSLVSDSATTPRVAIAISGGGYRAMLHGSGGLSALDARNNTALASLLQASVYMAGLSGGSWAVTVLCVYLLLVPTLTPTQSFAAADMASPYYLDSNVWNMEESLVDPSG